MERPFSVSCDRNIRDHLWKWSTNFGRNIPAEIRLFIVDKPVLCPNSLSDIAGRFGVMEAPFVTVCERRRISGCLRSQAIVS